MKRKLVRCPDCGKRGVYSNLNGSDDSVQCRYCDWYAFQNGNDDSDIRERNRLVAANPEFTDSYVQSLIDRWRKHNGMNKPYDIEEE